MYVDIDWVQLTEARPQLWRRSRCLYVYLHPMRDWILHVGIAVEGSVGRSVDADQRNGLIGTLGRRYRTGRLRVFYGAPSRRDGGQCTAELLEHIHSLLSRRLAPSGKQDGAAPPAGGEQQFCFVECHGDWPRTRRRFRGWI